MLGKFFKKAKADEPKVPCDLCGVLILPRTKLENKGRCASCSRISDEMLARRQSFDASVEEGSVFTPSKSELEGQTDPGKIVSADTPWESYRDECAASVWPDTETALEEFRRGERQFISMGDAQSFQMTFETNDKFGVITILSGSETWEELYLYAYTDENARTQIEAEHQLWAGCPCCGVGMFVHPSRAHMPVKLATDVFLAAIGHDYSRARWLPYDPNDHTERGKG